MLRFAALALGLLPLAAGAESFSGTIRVSDADTLRVGDVTVRLFGIDAPEIGQVCRLADGRDRDCGTWAKQQAAALYDGKRARCEPRDTDRYGRTVAVCRVAGEDIGARLVREGIAEAYRKYSLDYADLEGRDFRRARPVGRTAPGARGLSRHRSAGTAFAGLGLRHQGQHFRRTAHLSRAWAGLLSRDPDRRGERRALVLHRGRSAGGGLAAGAPLGHLIGVKVSPFATG